MRLKKTRFFLLGLLFLNITCIVSSKELPKSEPIKVLFIGNSFTSFAEKTLNTALGNSKHKKSKFKFHTVGGSFLALFLNEKFEYFKEVKSVINDGDWDFVVLQERSVAVGRDDDWGEAFETSVSKLSEIIRAAGAEPILFMTWARDDTREYADYDDMVAKLSSGYQAAGEQNDISLARVGTVWHEVRSNNENLGLELYADDNGHPTLKGQFLIAGVFFKLLFDDTLEFTATFKNEFSKSEWTEVTKAISSHILPLERSHQSK